MEQSPQFIYAAILESGFVKIGRTRNIKTRFAGIKQSRKTKAELIWSIEVADYSDAKSLEYEAVCIMEPYLVEGREWLLPEAKDGLPSLKTYLEATYQQWLSYGAHHRDRPFPEYRIANYDARNSLLLQEATQ
jgi:hypothetical protein